MKIYLVAGVTLVLIGVVFSISMKERSAIEKTQTQKTLSLATSSNTKTALLANGCFWCVEHDLARVDGVVGVVSGYAGGTTANPTYENYSAGGHREVVLVTYDPAKVSYANLVEHILKHGNPTDAEGSFVDRGPQYAPAIYFEDPSEKDTAESIIRAMGLTARYAKPLTIAVIPRVEFWPAEEYHQDYAEKNPVRYKYYRNASGRDTFIDAHWQGRENEFTLSRFTVGAGVGGVATTTKNKWESFVRPFDVRLRAQLTPLQYEVTQEDGTEPPFNNAYDKNYDEGIYVDIVSGEPLFSSKDKYDSGTGWPSFVAPISRDAVVLKEDKHLFITRIEVRSRYADSHLGHVFTDGPSERGGKRYCMNSASLRFIPKSQMELEGYGAYLSSL